MISLLRKDYYNLASQIKIYIIILLLAAFLSWQNKDLTFLTFLPAMLPATILLSSFAYDEMSNFDVYALSQPISKKDLVKEKYLLSICVSLAAGIFSIILMYALVFVFGKESFQELEFSSFFITIIMVACVMNILNAIMIPMIYQYGTEKSRIFFVILALGFSFGIYTIAPHLAQFQNNALIQFLLDHILISAAAVLLFFEVLSLQISYRIINRKEF